MVYCFLMLDNIEQGAHRQITDSEKRGLINVQVENTHSQGLSKFSKPIIYRGDKYS